MPISSRPDPRPVVYTIRDRDNRIVYVGRGRSEDRAQSHAADTHNARLAAILDTPGYTIDVAEMPDHATAAVVESILIDVLSPGVKAKLANVRRERWRFTPLGTPPEYAHRLGMEPLTVADLGRSLNGVLIVFHSSKPYRDLDRPRADAGGTDPAVLAENTVRWWQLGPWARQWAADPQTAPRAVVAVKGPTARRYVRSAIATDPAGWTTATREGASYQIPTIHNGDTWTHDNLDHARLRGRLVHDAKFSNRAQDLVIWVDSTGTAHHQS
ncbi:hypothetical protein ACFRCG_38050 [Embleya sp. NPDC056575]|uniref:hypothetical protein n=1 Tax=unclassified Embleya TaxID=2699296 RepID=UPI0036AF96D0